MIRNSLKWIPIISVMSALLVWFPASAGAAPKSFAYLNHRYAITAEIASEHKFVLNFINLSDFVIVIQPSEFIYRGASGRFYVGQVFEMESKNQRGETQKYSASYLLKGHSFIGFAIIGAFHELDQIEDISVRIGARRYYLQPVESSQFEQLAVKLGNLDLENPSSAAALEEANISEIGSEGVGRDPPCPERRHLDLRHSDGGPAESGRSFGGFRGHHPGRHRAQACRGSLAGR